MNTTELIAQQMMKGNINKIPSPPFINVQDPPFYAKGDGVTDNTAAIQAAIDAAMGTTNLVFIPYNTMYTQASLTIPQGMTLWDESASFPAIKDLKAFSQKNSMTITRDANYTGGTPGWVNAALYAYTTARAGTTSFEWGITSVMHNYATAGENVGIYGQVNKYAVGPSWGGVFEARDQTNTNTVGGLVGIEVDVMCNGADTGSRIGIDIVVGKGVAAGATGNATDAIRIGPVNGDSTQGTFVRGLHTTGPITAGIKLDHTGTWGISGVGSFTVGLDLSNATISADAIRLATNQRIALDATGTMALKYNSTTGFIEFYNGATRKGYIDMNGADHAL